MRPKIEQNTKSSTNFSFILALTSYIFLLEDKYLMYRQANIKPTMYANEYHLISSGPIEKKIGLIDGKLR